MLEMTKLLMATVAVAMATAAYAEGYRAVPPVLPVCSVIQHTSDGFVAMRDGPGVEYPLLTQLYPGDVVFESEFVGPWVHISYILRRGPVSGWVYGNYIRQAPCPDVALPAIVPPPVVPVVPVVPVQPNGQTINNNITVTVPQGANNNNNNIR
jgi:hypothetical protein